MMGLSPEEEKALKNLETIIGQVIDSNAPKTPTHNRQGIRVANRLEVKFETHSEIKQTYIKNISGGGLYVETDKFQAVGTIVTVHLSFQQGTEPEPVQCEVAWVNPKDMPDLPPGMGVKFHKISDAVRSKVQRLVDSMVEAELKKKAAEAKKIKST
jgi:uncharacterized protein (TIGR02266 family)